MSSERSCFGRWLASVVVIATLILPGCTLIGGTCSGEDVCFSKADLMADAGINPLDAGADASTDGGPASWPCPTIEQIKRTALQNQGQVLSVTDRGDQCCYNVFTSCD
jgi:hypothetical protein